MSQSGQSLCGIFQLHNGLEMECSDGESTERSAFKPKFGAVPKSPQKSKMDWETQTVQPPRSSYFPPHFRPFRMPSMVSMKK
jgi:hypothetical protein